MREDRDPLLGQGRIRRLLEAGIPLRIPGIEPVLRVVRCKEDVEVRVVRPERKLHQQQRPVDQKGHQENKAERQRTVGTVDEV